MHRTHGVPRTHPKLQHQGTMKFHDATRGHCANVAWKEAWRRWPRGRCARAIIRDTSHRTNSSSGVLPRDVRRELTERFGDDIDALCDFLVQEEKRHEDRLVNRAPRASETVRSEKT